MDFLLTSQYYRIEKLGFLKWADLGTATSHVSSSPLLHNWSSSLCKTLQRTVKQYSQWENSTVPPREVYITAQLMLTGLF